MTTTTDRITELLNQHEIVLSFKQRLVYCSGCDWYQTYGQGVDSDLLHRAHVASLLAVLVADAQADTERERDEARAAHAELIQACGKKYEALRERAAATWDEGRLAGVSDMSRIIGWGVQECRGEPPEDTPNPYRKVSGSGEGEKLQQQIDASEGEEHAGSDKVVGTHTPHNTPNGDENE